MTNIVTHIRGLFSFLSETNNTFEDKKPYELVITVLRRHWFVIFTQIFAHTMILVLFGGFLTMLIVYFENIAIFSFLSFVFFMFLLFWWSKLFYIVTMYLLDIWIVTDHRIIVSKQCGFFCREVSEIGLGKIQDVSVGVSGLIATYLNFGEINIQSAGSEQKINLLQIADPYSIKEKITHCQSNYSISHVGGVEIHERVNSL